MIEGVGGVEWWSELVNLNLSFLPCISVRNDHHLSWQRLLPERIPFNRLCYTSLFSRVFYFSLSSKHHFAPSFQPYWEETPVLHSKHKNQNHNKKQANSQNSDIKGPFIYTFSHRTENSGVLSSFISFCLTNFNLT